MFNVICDSHIPHRFRRDEKEGFVEKGKSKTWYSPT